MSIDPPHMLIFVGPHRRTRSSVSSKKMTITMGVTRSLGSCPRVTSAMSAIGGTNTEDHENHPCEGKWCPSCHRKDCPDFAEAKRLLGPGKFPSPSSLCRLCHRSFFGEDCYSYHLHRRSKNIPSICDTYKKCLECCKTYEGKTKKKKSRRG